MTHDLIADVPTMGSERYIAHVPFVNRSTMTPIRIATSDDLPEILAISNWAAVNTAANFAIEPETLESWQEEYNATREKYPWFVAADDSGDIIGFAKASPYHGRCAYLYSAEISVYVHPDHHRRRIGRSLYDRLLPTLEAQGYHSLIAAIALPNDASVRLHESSGLERTGTFHDVGWKFGKWHDVGYWQIRLRGDEPPASIKHVRDVVREK